MIADAKVTTTAGNSHSLQRKRKGETVNLDRIFNLLGSIVVLGTVTVVVMSPNSARIVSATGGAFTNALRAAMGSQPVRGRR